MGKSYGDVFDSAHRLLADRELVMFAVDGPDWLDNPPAVALDARQQEALLARNGPALAMLRSGLTSQYVVPAANPSAMELSVERTSRLRDLVRLLRLECAVRSGCGDAGGAALSCVDAIEFAMVSARGGPVMAGLTAFSFQRVACANIWHLIDRLPGGDASAAAKRLDRIREGGPTTAEYLAAEKAFMLESLRLAFGSPDWASRVLGYDDAVDPKKPALWQRIGIALLGRRRVERRVAQYIDAVTAYARNPRLLSPPRPPRVPPLTGLSGVVEAGVLAETQLRLLATGLALHAYQRRVGKYPATLQMLVPDHLVGVPRDPFAEDGPLRYRLHDDRYILYSVGADGVDDGGQPVDDQGRWSALIDPSAHGDIVGGVNVGRPVTPPT